MLIRCFLAVSLLTTWASTGAAVEQGQLDASPALFTVLAAINAAGYDTDLDSPSNSPLRAAIRAEVLKRKPASLDAIRRFFAEHKKKDGDAEYNQYLWLALAIDGPPKFDYRYRTNELPPEVTPLEDFRLLLPAFYKEANLEELWKKSQPEIERVLARYQPGIIAAVGQVNAYMRGSSGEALGTHFQIYVDLLGAPNQVQMRTWRNDYFAIVTPAAEPQIDGIRHAYIHNLVDALSVRYAPELEKKRPLIDYALGAPLLPEAYKNDFGLLATESLVKAIESRLAPVAQRQGLVDTAMGEGYILTAAFASELTAYEKQEQGLRYFYPEMAKGIDLRQEVERLEQVKFATERPRKARPVMTERPSELVGVQKTLADAEQAYSRGATAKAHEEADKAQAEFVKASAGFQKALKETTDKRLQAQAYYGLARVATLQNHPDEAEDLFGKVLELSPEPQILAWTHVYLGRLADASDQREQALVHYRAALDVKGGTDAARKAAQDGLDRAFTR